MCYVKESRCRITIDRWDFVWEIKYWGLQTLNIIIFTFFSIKWIKETYLWCIPVFFGVNSSICSRVFWLLLCDPCYSLHNTKLRELGTPVVSVKSYSPGRKTSLSKITGQGCFQALLTLSGVRSQSSLLQTYNFTENWENPLSYHTASSWQDSCI